MNGNVDITFLKIKRAVEKNTECFFCDIETEIEFRYLTNYLQELVMDSKARDRIVESRGFCNNHFYKLLIEASKPTTSDQHGVALIMQSIIDQLIQDITLRKNTRKNNSKILVGKNCPACSHVNEYIKMYFIKAAGLLASEEFKGLLQSSKGMCIPHFAILTRMVESEEAYQTHILEFILEIERKNLERLKDELAEYIKRQSYEFSETDRRALADVVPRSVGKIAGIRGTMAPKQTWEQ